MTADEAKARAQLIFTETRMGPGVEDRLEQAIAAELIKAQIQAYEYAYAIHPWEKPETPLTECRAALSKLEGRDDRNSNH